MKYFPKSQIKTNLYTYGGEFTIISTGEEYNGAYWTTSTGKFFTGKNPQDVPIQQLQKIIFNTENTNPTLLPKVTLAIYNQDPDPEINRYSELYNGEEIGSYIELKNINEDYTIAIPYYSPNVPTTQDYDKGIFKRYFCKKVNEIYYLEINFNIYRRLIQKEENILYQLYQPFYINWYLRGNIENVYVVNFNTVELVSKKLNLPKFEEYLKKDYLEYYLP